MDEKLGSTNSTIQDNYDTRIRILDVAEQVFAENGPGAASIRVIAKKADVNLGAVNYHFGTKDRLFEEVLKRRIQPLNEQRIQLIDECVSSVGPDGKPDVYKLVLAIVQPSIELWKMAPAGARSLLVMQFLVRAYSIYPRAAKMLEDQYGPVRRRFISAMSRAKPELSDRIILHRYNFLVGAILYSIIGPASTHADISYWTDEEFDRITDNIVSYAANGFSAPTEKE